MTSKEVKRSLGELSGGRFQLHCYEKSATHFVVYGRVEGRPSPECERFLSNLELTQLGKHKVLSYSYDQENTCLCLELDKSTRRVKRIETPRTRLRSLSDCPVLGQVPISSYEALFLQYQREGNTAGAKEIRERAVNAGLAPTPAMLLHD